MSNEHEEKSVALNFLAGMGLGALIGAATALLLAPKPGFETRQDIVNATEDLRSKANRVMNDLSASSDDLVKKSRELLEATKAKVHTAVETGRQTVAGQCDTVIEDKEQS